MSEQMQNMISMSKMPLRSTIVKSGFEEAAVRVRPALLSSDSRGISIPVNSVLEITGGDSLASGCGVSRGVWSWMSSSRVSGMSEHSSRTDWRDVEKACPSLEWPVLLRLASCAAFFPYTNMSMSIIKIKNTPKPQRFLGMVHHYAQGREQTLMIVGILECSVLPSIWVGDERENACVPSNSNPYRIVAHRSSPDIW